MFYYAEIDNNYLVVDVHELTVQSANSNYIPITQEQYTSGNLVGKYFNKLNSSFEILGDNTGSTDWVNYRSTQQILSTVLDNLRADVNEKAKADHTHTIATENASGLMSYEDKVKLNGIEAGANNYTHPETHSANMITGLSNVATSGSYNDLSDKPTIPAVPASLPANGGNADTVDGKHANDFATATHNHNSEYAALSHNHDLDYAPISHNHNNYALATDVAEIEETVNGKANISHSHSQSDISGLSSALSGKANATHTHTEYVTNTDFSALETAVDGKAEVNHTHSQYANVSHTHTQYAATNHTHNQYAATNHTHSNYATTADVETLETEINGKAEGIHTHAQSDITGLVTALSGKANTSHNHSVATTSENGFMSSVDKSKLDDIATGANKTTVDNALSGTSTNPVQNKVVNTALSNKVDKVSGKALSTNDYTTAEKNKLAGIAAEANNYIHPSTHAASMITGLANVATSGDYNDLANKPTSMSPTAHTHAQGEITGLSEALSNKAPLNSVEVLETGTNLNNYKTAGMYSFSVSSAPLNMPNGCTNGWLIVIPWNKGSNTIKQIFLRHGTPSSTDCYTYTRLYTVTGGWGSWSTFYTTNNPPTANDVGAISKDLMFTNNDGGVEYSYGANSGKNVLTEISNMAEGFHTIYAITGTTGNPETTESYRYFIHKTSNTIGWIYAFGADGSIYSNYQSAKGTFKGWRTIHDTKRKPLWTGSYYMTAGHTVTPSKKLSDCEHGWILLWSDYDPDTGTVNNTDFCTTMIPNRNWTGGTWNGAAWYCDCPRYAPATATDSESRIIKVLNVYNNKLVGNTYNNVAPRNDVILRAVYEF